MLDRKFVLLTRGRTGSTAVLDSLGKSTSLGTMQELFLRPDNPAQWPEGEVYYKILPPFDFWKQQVGWLKRILFPRYRDSRQAHIYLMHAEELVHRQGVKGFGWKMLSHHFDQRPFLCKLLKKHGYRFVYLRRNSVRQVLSGMVASQRGIYNSVEKVVDEHRYHINLDEFKNLVQWERECVKNDCARLSAEGFDFIEVHYEDYCDNREEFFGKIFNLLNLPLELPPASDFVKVIKDLRMVIENYDEVANAAALLGEGL